MLGNKPTYFLANLPENWAIAWYPERIMPFTVFHKNETIAFCSTEQDARNIVEKQIRRIRLLVPST